MTSILKRAISTVAADPRPRSLAILRSELVSRDRDRRVVALVRIRRQMETAGQKPGYLTLASRYVKDPDSTCRWQATIVVGEFIVTHRDHVWRIAHDLAKSPNADVRTAAATVLLEHLLEHHPKDMIPRFRAEIAAGDRRFAKSVASCSNFGNSRTRVRIQRLLDEAGA